MRSKRQETRNQTFCVRLHGFWNVGRELDAGLPAYGGKAWKIDV